MFLLPLLLFRAGQAPTTADLDAMAQQRDVAGLSTHLTPDSLEPINPLQVLKTNGAYDVGRMGWHVYDLVPPNKSKSFVVFGTPLTSEDIGEMVFEREGGALKYVPEWDPLGVRIVRHHFDVSFDIPSKKVSIEDDLDLKKLPDAGSFFFIRMSPYLHVDSITSGGKDVPYMQASGVTAITAFPGQTATLDIRYSGVCSLPQYAGSITDNEAQLTNDYWYPMIARWPAAYDATIHSPKGWLGIAQGEQVSMTEDANGRTTKYRMDLPVTYYSLSAAPYTMATLPDGKWTFKSWSLVRTPEQLQEETEFLKPIIHFYNDNFAPFPFSGYGVLCSRLYGGGALEAYSFATYGFGVPDEDPHEPSHTWWGGMIDNTYMHSLWNESFAVFCEGFYRRNVPIGNHAERSLAYIEDPQIDPSDNTAPCETASPWYGNAASSLGYGKGAYVLQMLENELGTDTMLKTMQTWQKENPKGSPGEWSGYEKAVADVTHKDYKWFWDEWLRRTGWAKFEVRNVKWVQGLLTGEVYFTGDPYKVDCELMMQYADGSRDFTKFDTMQEKVGDHFVFVIHAPKDPILVSIDPWRRVLRSINRDEAPVSVSSMMGAVTGRYSDQAHGTWLKGMGGEFLSAEPKDLSNVMLVGTPDSIPDMALLCGKAGFKVRGNSLTYDGTTIDLNDGGAMAVVDLPNGKHCVIGLGNFKVHPDFGRARTVVFDSLGRFLRGWTEPKTSGFMTFNLSPGGSKTNPTSGMPH